MKTTEKVPDNLNKRYQKKKMTHTHTPFQSIQLAGKGRRKEKKKEKLVFSSTAEPGCCWKRFEPEIM